MSDLKQTVPLEILQDVLDAEASTHSAATSGLNQYSTPDWLARIMVAGLPDKQPETVIDFQCGEGALLKAMTHYAWKYGVDMDPKATSIFGASVLIANCAAIGDILDDLHPDLRWEASLVNPPFSKRWKVGDHGKVVDSTQWTWDTVTRRSCYGAFLANASTIERLNLHRHPYVLKYQTFENAWPGVNVVAGVIWWQHPGHKNGQLMPTRQQVITSAWLEVKRVAEEERKQIPEWNVWLDNQGKLKVHLSQRLQIKRKLATDEIKKLASIGGAHPLTLVTERETRTLLAQLVDQGVYRIEPDALKAIREALAEVHRLACPVMPVTDFASVAYADEEETLLCRPHSTGLPFTPGKRYTIDTATYTFKERFVRKKIHYNEEDGDTYTAEHDCVLSGQDRYIQVQDDNGRCHRFMDKPREGNPFEKPESMLWQLFEQPKVETVAERYPEAIAKNLRLLRSCEMLAGFKYYPGQLEYIARVGIKDNGLIGAAVGTGKSNIAISLIAMKGPERALIIAPQGTMKAPDDDEEDGIEVKASQWITELRTFAPYFPVFELFSMDDYHRILRLNGGELPPGVFVTYYEALLSNQALEVVPSTWDDERLAKEFKAALEEHPSKEPDGWCKSVGQHNNGIRCICRPSMATQIGHLFDMVVLDEAHSCKSLSAGRSQSLIRLQPKYRYAMSATPISNTVSDLFSIMGWLSVDNWYKGDLRNAAWPYSVDELARFDETFKSTEQDITEERTRRAKDPNYRGKCIKVSPVISSPARLLKLLQPTLSYISKEACNPNLVKCSTMDVRVPMGRQQAALYAHFLDRGNIDASHPLVRARKQIAYLRAICADPAGFKHGGPKVLSNFNPKTVAILELITQLIAKGEQVVTICARVGQSTELSNRLVSCGIPVSRIDSSIPADHHAQQSNWFKSGRTRVLLMGIKCAMAHSFPDCPNEIIGSLEYSPGPLEQAKGRVYRVNSRRPVNVWCILNSNSLEEIMHDTVAVKGDAATICLRGERLPREFKPTDMSEVLAESVTKFNLSSQPDELEMDGRWPALQAKLRAAMKPWK